MVRENLLHNDGTTYLLDAYAIMPTHVHTLVMPLPGAELDVIVGSWRKYSARKINEICGTEGSYWSEEPFDHIVRSGESMARFRRYVLDNPTKIPHLHALSGQGSFAKATGVKAHFAIVSTPVFAETGVNGSQKALNNHQHLPGTSKPATPSIRRFRRNRHTNHSFANSESTPAVVTRARTLPRLPHPRPGGLALLSKHPRPQGLDAYLPPHWS